MAMYGAWCAELYYFMAEGIVRTKDEMVNILAQRQLSDMLMNSTWSDLVSAISAYDQQQKNKLVKLIATRKSKLVGELLYQALLDDAKGRALSYVNARLADDSLSLQEIDELL